jgi:Baseplate J-like protein
VTLPVPNLDDRTFIDLVREARARIQQSYPEWTDLTVHDPGVALIEVFAHLTEVMLYRLNRLPEKAYVEFLNLLGVARHPPAAAWVDLSVSRTGTGTEAVAIPAGTRIVAARGADPQPVVFVTTESAVLPAGQNEIDVRVHHCEIVDAELLGTGTGRPGQVLRSARSPIVSTTEAIDLLLGVEADPGGPAPGMGARDYGGKTFEIWRQVHTFAGLGPRDKVYLLDRASGTVTFAPALDLRRDEGAELTGQAAAPAAELTGQAAVAAAELTTLAAVPGAGRQIRLWYRIGGGPAGNVAPDTLTSLRDPLPGVKVTNKAPARGGRALEPIDAAMVRGPYEFFSLRRAITARDFELLATANSGAIARARAFTRSAMWSFARPGEVEVVLVPYVGAEQRPGWRLPVDVLMEHQVDEARRRTEQDLDRRRALGTSVVASWAMFKPVSVRGRVVVRPEEDVDAVARRIHDRLYQTVSPLPTPLSPTGWQFGEPLRASNVYRMLEQAEPGVRYVDEVRFVLQDAPDGRVRTVAADHFQPKTWWVGADTGIVFRSTNDGLGWEPVGRFAGEPVFRVCPAPAADRPGVTPRPGCVAAITRRPDGGSGVYVSTDLGTTWQRIAELEPTVTDVTWVDRDEAAALLLATDVGLYELALLPRATPLQVMVEQSDMDRGFYAVRAFVSERGVPGVAVAAQARYGVYLSTSGGASGTFTNVGLSGMDTRTLAVQYDGPATLLWAGLGEPDASKSGRGAVRARLFEADVKWEAMSAGWTGGTCWDLAFAGGQALAATQSGGVLRLDTGATGPQWQPADVNNGLPLRDRTRFEAVEAVEAGAGSGGVQLAGDMRGVYRSADGQRWAPAAGRESTDLVTIPDTWLLCSAEHAIEVVRQDATSGD